MEFQNVWFAYDRPHSAAPRAAAEPEWVLRNVSFTARPGQTLAIVGHTGAGKTTIVSLLMRFYDPQKGRILVNGKDVRDMPVEQLRELIGYVQQDIFLFAGDVASNIRLSAPLSDEQVQCSGGAGRGRQNHPPPYKWLSSGAGRAWRVDQRRRAPVVIVRTGGRRRSAPC